MNRVIGVILIVAFFSACATTRVNINTNVPGAQVTVDGKTLGATPIFEAKIKNSTGKTYQVIIEKEGYETMRGVLQKETKSANAAAVVVGYALCWLVLPMLLWINGAWMEGPVPDQYFVLTESGK